MITDRQMKRTLMIELFSTTGLFVPAMAQNVQQLCVGLFAAACYAAYFLWIGKTYRIEQTGKIRKTIYMLRFFIYACFLGTLMKLLVSKMLLKGGSGWFLFLPVFILAIYANQNGREKRARLLELLFWFVFTPLFLVLILAVKNIHLSYLIQNGFETGHSIQVFLCFCSLEILLFFQGSRKEKCKALGFVFFFNVVVFVITIGMYGFQMVEYSDFPVVTIIQMVRFPGGFVERLDIFILAFWILSLFAVFSAYCFYGTQYCQKKYSIITAFFYLGVFVIVSGNTFELKEAISLFQTYLLWLDLPLAILLPLLGNKKRQRTIMITLLSAVLLIVTGCTPKRVNIEDRAYVLAMDIEKEEDLWAVGFFLPDHQFIRVEGTDWDQIQEEYQKSSDKKLELSHLKAIIVGKDADWKALEEDWKLDQEYAKTVLLFRTDCTMYEFARADQSQEKPLGSLLADLAEQNQKETTLGDYLAGTKEAPEVLIRTNFPTLE
jgi:hypothetical protein